MQYIQEAEKLTKISNHMIYMSYPLVKDKKIILKVLDEIKTAVANSINAILQYEYLFRRIIIYEDPHLNFRTFLNKTAPNYGLSDQEIVLTKELFEISKQHKQSSMEFVRGDKIVIMVNGIPKSIDLDKVKQFIHLSQKILEKIKQKIIKKV